MHPYIAPLNDPTAHLTTQSHVQYSEMLHASSTRRASLYSLPECAQLIQLPEAMRKELPETECKSAVTII